jgi:predicted amidophosphoribosyltransferase
MFKKKNIKSKRDLGESQKVCSKCGHRLEPHDKACPNCNLQLEKNKPGDILMICRSCRKTISTGVDSCPHCGESYNQ